MKTTLVGTGAAGLITAVAGAGWYAVVGLGLLLLALLAMICWVVTNRSRTRNAVALITAARGQTTQLPRAGMEET